MKTFVQVTETSWDSGVEKGEVLEVVGGPSIEYGIQWLDVVCEYKGKYNSMELFFQVPVEIVESVEVKEQTQLII